MRKLNSRGSGCPLARWKFLRGLSLDIRRGEFVAVVGPFGLRKIDAVECLSAAINLSSGSSSCATGVRMVYQQDGLFPWQTVSENISLGLRSISVMQPNASGR